MSSRRYGIKVIYLSKVKEVSRNSTCEPGPPDVSTPGCFVYDNPCGPAKCKNYEQIRTGTIQNLGWTIDEGIAQELVDKTEAEETALYNSVLAAATAWKNSQVLYRETRNTESPWCTGHVNWLDERFYNYDFIILSGVNLTTSNKKIVTSVTRNVTEDIEMVYSGPGAWPASNRTCVNTVEDPHHCYHVHGCTRGIEPCEKSAGGGDDREASCIGSTDVVEIELNIAAITDTSTGGGTGGGGGGGGGTTGCIAYGVRVIWLRKSTSIKNQTSCNGGPLGCSTRPILGGGVIAPCTYYPCNIRSTVTQGGYDIIYDSKEQYAFNLWDTSELQKFRDSGSIYDNVNNRPATETVSSKNTSCPTYPNTTEVFTHEYLKIILEGTNTTCTNVLKTQTYTAIIKPSVVVETNCSSSPVSSQAGETFQNTVILNIPGCPLNCGTTTSKLGYAIPPSQLPGGTGIDAQCLQDKYYNPSTGDDIGFECGAPDNIKNQNLIKAGGGLPGFITLTRHMCVGDSIEVGEFTKPQYSPVLGKTVKKSPTAAFSDYPYACGYFDYVTKVTATSMTDSTSLWNCAQECCSKWFDFFCHFGFGCFKCNNPTSCNRAIMDKTMSINYLTNPSQPTRLQNTLRTDGNVLGSDRFNIKFQNLTPLIKDYLPAPDVKVHSIVRHPRMNREELRYFGVREEDFDKILVAASGTDIKIHYDCIHAESGSFSIAFFKWDLSTIVKHAGRVTVKGKTRDLYQIASQQILNNGMHSTDKMMDYTLGTWFHRNGANKGNTGGGGTQTVTIPKEPFWDDNTVMVVFVGNRKQRLGDYSSSKKSDYVNITDANWSSPITAPFIRTTVPWSNNAGDPHACGCTFSIEVPQYTELATGCSQTRNLDWSMYSTDALYRQVKNVPQRTQDDPEYDQLWNSPSQGSHIMKIVPENYYDNECTWRISGEIKPNKDIAQNSVVYAANCLNSVGDPYMNANGFISKESPAGIHYLEKCNSYSINVSPNAEISNQSRCCSPKISGPFILEQLPHGEVENAIKKDSLHDGPDLVNNYRPNLNYYSKNFAYNLEFRIDCECGSSDCARTKCYDCPSQTKTEYEQCLVAPECQDKQDCCVNPCTSCPKNYNDCIRTGDCETNGCCAVCEDCYTETLAEYNSCIANTGEYAIKECHSRNCCSLNCDACPKGIQECNNISICAAQNCCEFNCDVDCLYPGPGNPIKTGGLVNRGTVDSPRLENKTLIDYWNCILKRKQYTVYPQTKCATNCCCRNPCDKYRDGTKLIVRDDGTKSPFTRADCEVDPICVAQGCVGYLPPSNAGYSLG